jgi:hypothetical protein
MTTIDIEYVKDESTTTFGKRPTKRTTKTTFVTVSGLLPLADDKSVIESVTIIESTYTGQKPSLVVEGRAKRPGQNWAHNIGWASAAISRARPIEDYGPYRARLDDLPDDLTAVVEGVIATGGPLNDAFPTED